MVGATACGCYGRCRPVVDGRALVVSCGSGRVEPPSPALTTAPRSEVFVDGELGGECCGLLVADRVAVEVSWLVGPATGSDGPGSAGKLAGYGGVGRDVIVAAFDHEPPVVLGELRVVAAGHVGGLVESKAKLGRSLFGDSP